MNKVEAKDWTPEKITPATEEYFATLDDEAFVEATSVKPKALSPVDPAAQFTGAQKAHSIFAYSTNYLVDLDNSVIVDVETTAAIRQAEVNAALDMVDRVEETFGFYPERFVGPPHGPLRCNALPGKGWGLRQRRNTGLAGA